MTSDYKDDKKGPISSDREVKAAKKGERTVTGATGLILRVHPGSDGKLTRNWIVRVTDKGRRRRVGLGHYPTVTLAKARELATDAHRKIAQGIDPSQTARRQQQSAADARFLTLRKAIDDYLAKAASTFKNPKSDEIRRRALLVHFGSLHAKDVAQIAPADIADVLRPLRPETASRAYTAIRAVLDYAEAVLRPRGVVIHNPASTRPLAALGWRRKSRKTHAPHPAVSWRIMPEVISETRKLNGVDAACMMFIIATCVRAGTAREAKWADFDFEEKTWAVQPADLKDGWRRKVPFVVPLNDLALDVLAAMREHSPSPYAFAGSPGRPIATGDLINLTRRLRRKHDNWRDPHTRKQFVIHGFRAAFKTWSREAGLDPERFNHIPPREIAELILGHQIGSDVEQAYDRSAVLDARRTMLDLWASHCRGAKILGFPQRA